MIAGSPTVRPVDGPGWYECVDGSVVQVKYLVGNGTMHTVTQRVASWAEVGAASVIRDDRGNVVCDPHGVTGVSL